MNLQTILSYLFDARNIQRANFVIPVFQLNEIMQDWQVFDLGSHTTGAAPGYEIFWRNTTNDKYVFFALNIGRASGDATLDTLQIDDTVSGHRCVIKTQNAASGFAVQPWGTPSLGAIVGVPLVVEPNMNIRMYIAACTGASVFNMDGYGYKLPVRHE